MADLRATLLAQIDEAERGGCLYPRAELGERHPPELDAYVDWLGIRFNDRGGSFTLKIHYPPLAELRDPARLDQYVAYRAQAERLRAALLPPLEAYRRVVEELRGRPEYRDIAALPPLEAYRRAVGHEYRDSAALNRLFAQAAGQVLVGLMLRHPELEDYVAYLRREGRWFGWFGERRQSMARRWFGWFGAPGRPTARVPSPERLAASLGSYLLHAAGGGKRPPPAPRAPAPRSPDGREPPPRRG